MGAIAAGAGEVMTEDPDSVEEIEGDTGLSAAICDRVPARSWLMIAEIPNTAEQATTKQAV